MTTQSRTLLGGLAVALSLAALAAPEETRNPARPRCVRLTAAPDRGALDEDRQAMVTAALDDEHHGEALYARVLDDLGDIRPFANVVHAERRHAAFLRELLETRGLPVPEKTGAQEDGPVYASRQEACQAAVEFEIRNVALYDRFLADETLPEDVRAVFEHNRRASREHHKPAFERCASSSGQGHAASSVRRGGGHACGAGKGRQAGGCSQGCGCGGGASCGQGAGRGLRGIPTLSAPAESGS